MENPFTRALARYENMTFCERIHSMARDPIARARVRSTIYRQAVREIAAEYTDEELCDPETREGIGHEALLEMVARGDETARKHLCGW
jgi:hypothetical protein